MSLVPGEFGLGSTWRFALQLVPSSSLVRGSLKVPDQGGIWSPGGFTPAPGATQSFVPCSDPAQGGHLCSGHHVRFYSLIHRQVWQPEGFSPGPGSSQGFAPESGPRGLQLLLVLVPLFTSLRHADPALRGMCPCPCPSHMVGFAL